MSEIEKMYENAGIDYEERYNNCTLNKEGECKLKCSCDICKYSEEKYIYPPFTAEKQLGLTKFLLERGLECNTCKTGKDVKYALYIGYERSSGDFKEFTEALAGIINDLWQDLSKGEKEDLRGILRT